MEYQSVSPCGLVAIATYFGRFATPLAFTACSPSSRIAAEVVAFDHLTEETEDKSCPASTAFCLDPLTKKRLAVIADATQFELATWWLLRSRSRFCYDPYPLRSVELAAGMPLDTSLDSVTALPPCVSWITRINLNARCDQYNRLSSWCSIAALVHLRELYMKYTTIALPSLPPPPSYTEACRSVFRKIKTLVIGDYHLVKHLPVEEFCELVEVDLSGTGVSDATISALSNCTKIRSLSLCGCSNIHRFSPLASLSSLLLLNISQTNLADEALDLICRHCKSLQELNLYNCTKLWNLQPLASLAQLTTLQVGRTACNSFHLEAISSLPELQVLHMQGCRHIEDFRAFSRMRQLRELNIRATRLDDNGAAAILQCAQLQLIDASGCDAVRQWLPVCRLPQLRSADFSYTVFSDESLRVLCSSSSGLQCLCLNGCHELRDFNPVAKLLNLSELSVCDTAFNDDGLRAVAACPSLLKLQMHVCVGVSTLSPLAKCHQLRYIGVGATRFSNQQLTRESEVLRGRGVKLCTRLLLLSAHA